jgi:cytochrome b
MVLALLLSLGATTLSGMQLLALEEGKGPFAVVPASSLSPLATAVADDEELERSGHRDAGHGDGEELWEELHEIAVNLTLALIALHIVGVLVSGRMHRESLVRAMLTGYKRRQDSALG